MAAKDYFQLVGQVLDERHRVDEVVGEGGFGVVYKGFHLTFEQPIAIKCLKTPSHFTDEGQVIFLAKFREEAKLLSRLSQHPAIVRVYDFNTVKTPRGISAPYMVLEWLEGQPLDAWLTAREGQPMPEAEAVALLRPAIEALAHAHAEGIAHRDVKPANIFVVGSAQKRSTKVLDFGIAKAMQEGETATQMKTRTSSGFSAFSPSYGAPEQFRTKKFGPTGPWTDVHALGLILTEMVTGKPALEGEEQGDFMAASTDEARPTPSARGGAVSRAFEAVCARALARVAGDRYRDAGELLKALDEALALPFVAAERPAPVAPATAAPQVEVGTRGSTDPSAATVLPPTQESPGAPAAPPAPTPVRHGVSTTAPVVESAVAVAPAAVPPDPGASPRRPLVVGVAAVAGVLALGGVGYALFGGRHDPAPVVSSPSPSASTPVPVEAGEPAASAAAAVVPQPDASTGNAPDMVPIPAGSYAMGSPAGVGNPDEHPQHTVKVDAFQMDRTEVTVSAYDACVHAKSCTLATPGANCNEGRADRASHPINCVDWNQARAYCEWAGKRLPTEEEWEYAARGTEGRVYPWGNEAPEGQLCWKRMNGPTTGTCPVGSFPAGDSPLGLHDMAGNVWEWTASGYSKDYSQPRENARVFRGASWGNEFAAIVRAAYRFRNVPADHTAYVGFRCAK